MAFPVAKLSLGFRLFFLAATGIVPLAVFAAFAMMSLVQDRRAEAERAALELSRAMASAVQAELRSTIAGLNALALATQLDDDKVLAFDELARRALGSYPLWQGMLLTDAAGRVVAVSGLSVAPAEYKIADRESLERVIASQRPAVGTLTRGQRGRYAIAIRVPVTRDGQLRYVVSAVIRPDGIRDILTAQKLPTDWVVAVTDADDIVVARSRAHEKSLGGPPSATLRQMLSTLSREAVQMTYTLEGDPVYTGMTRISEFGWTVAVGIPAESVEATGNRSLVVYGVGILVSIVLSACLALLASRGISDPILRLRAAATALGRGDPVEPIESGIREIDEVGVTLTEASIERALAENEKEQLREAEHQALEQAQRASRAKDEFMAMLGHELRNPLAPIVTSLEIIRLRGDKQHEPQLQVIKRQVAHMTRLVDDLLDVSRIAAGRLELDLQLVEVNGIVERALEAVAPLTARRARPIQVQYSAQPAWVQADPIRLVQVVTNLLTNALKFTEPDAHIGLKVQVSGSAVHIEVDDAGAGIAPDLLPQVFDTFVQGHQPLSRRSGGLGLGLAIVKNLVEMHGGNVSAESAGRGAGSRFKVVLPASSHLAATITADVLKEDQFRHGTILIVDDNVDAADSLANALSLSGHEVRHVHDAHSALDVVKSFAPDVAILDIGLPTIDGYQLAERLRAEPRLAACQLIAVTGYGQDSDRARALAAGFAEHLTKPVELAALVQIIQRLLERSAPRT